ncbi:MAG: hypothetical protein Q9162_006581 [Coniocarpon cinnabarinum]
MTRHRALLESDPFEVEVGSADQTESFLLQPIDRTKGVPDSWKSLRRAMELMGQSESTVIDAGAAKRKAKEKGKVDKKRQAKEDKGEIEDVTQEGARRNEFDNLIPLLTGLRTAGRKWKPWQWEIIARTAGEHGATYALLNAARQAEKTGLYLYDLRVVREIVWACRLHALKNDWSVESCTKALGYMEQLVRLMEEPAQKKERERAINKGLLDSKVNALRQPDVIGCVVEVAAARVAAMRKVGADGEIIGEAQKSLDGYLQRLLPNMTAAVDESTKAVAEAKPLGMVADYELLRWVPALHGLNVLQQESLASTEGLSQHAEKLSTKVSDAKAAVLDSVGGDEGGKRRGLIWCNAVQAV